MYFNMLEKDGKEKAQPVDRITEIKNRIAGWMKESADPAFTEYLKQMQDYVQNEEQRISILSDNLNNQYQVYQRNMRRRMMQPAQSMPQPAVPQETQRAVPQETRQAAPQEIQRATPQETQQVAPQEIRQAVPQETQRAVPQETQRIVPQEVPQNVKQPGTVRNTEFTIGAAVLGIVGSAFVLIAMVLLGLYYMEGIMKGLIMYAACVIVMVLSETVLRRRWPRLGMLFSAIGMAGLYVSTVINYWALGNFNEWVAVGITVAITIFIIWLSRRRDAVFYRILGMVALYCCFYLALQEKSIAGVIAPAELVTLTVMMLVINVMCLALPVRKERVVADIVHMSVNTVLTFLIYTQLFEAGAQDQKLFADVWHYLLFLAASVLVMQMIFVSQIRYKLRICQSGNVTASSSVEENMGICITYAISAVLYVLLILRVSGYDLILSDSMKDSGWLYRIICAETIFILCAFALLALGKRQEKWFTWYLLNLAILAIYFNADKSIELFAALLILLLAGKLVSFTGAWLPRISDVIITILSCGAVVIAYDQKASLLLFAGILVSVFCISYWQTYFEVFLAYTIAWYTAANMLPVLRLPVFVGILFVCMLIFNNIKRLHGEGILIFHICALAGQVICYILLLNPAYRNAYLTYLCMLVFGIAVISVCFQRQYHLDFAAKPLIFAIFLTYMSLVVRTDFAIVNSILLMLSALICVGMGFYIRDKALRIYGLVLSLLVCGKLVLYDFAGSNALQRMIVFFIVGLIALAIASIYMILEKNMQKYKNGNVEESMQEILAEKESAQL